ncbi:MAG TPA: metal-dependent hydrolase [Spirochaetota bacterium]|nr:metal-dependent hydrolase [Spirochaetota bacterium]HOM38371.1 metal-dependent hydrolase [Spirochaetota bacterium]HPQ48411.1 metal-dependent hydrolase [Spirochaetota bacterium]
MTPPEHFAIGFALGNLAYSSFQLSKGIREDKYKKITYTKTIIIMTLSAMLPDIDSFFGHYTSNDPWVGHRGMTHSFIGISVLGLGLVFLMGMLSSLFRIITGYWRLLYKYFSKKEGIQIEFNFGKFIFYPFYYKTFLLYFLIAFIGGLSHLVCDLFQPPSVWGGLPLFFPLKVNGVYHRIGGFSTMGWYELKVFWITVGSVFISTAIILIVNFLKKLNFKLFKYLTITLFILVILFHLTTFVWSAKIILNGNYKDDFDWYKKQMSTIEKEMPTFVNNFTKKSVRIFSAIFKASQKS